MIFQKMFSENVQLKDWNIFANVVSKDQLIITCGHYVLSDQEFMDKIKSNFSSADKIIQKRIKSKLGLLNEQTKNYCI